ncbi:DUF3618 domain-containing protein [Mycolicibacterium iranicum]|uniref:DUF3618 domain-containing protein n=1 Tax=Mycolicibacterium iranicum TaxID=912594 RepID=A0A178LWP6_MYCIR|nr:DUF3618 domain-containing protein [Mycolicibacterium iranicum]OAN38962.1 hypothetical protein A4X20_19485 [Mycolicibacterium iranicum]
MTPEPEPRSDPSIDALKADIEQTRVDLGETVGALSDKLDVKSRAKDAIADVKDTVAQRGHDVVDSAKQRPALPAALLVAALLGVALVIWRRRR